MVHSHSGTLYSNEDEQGNTIHRKRPHYQEVEHGKSGRRLFIL